MEIFKGVKLFKFVLIVGILFFSMLFIFALLKSNTYPSGSMNKYYIASIVGILLLTIVLFKSRNEIKANIAILLFTSFISLYAIEIYLESAKREKLNMKIDIGENYDKRTRYEVLKDLRNTGIDAYPSVMPYIFFSSQYDSKINIYPIASISDKTTVYCRESEKYAIFETDEHGFRNPTGLYNKGNVDIVLIGDSFVQGACVQTGEDIAGWLRSSGKNILNLGMGGNGPLIEFATIKEYVEPLSPKFVFWFYYEGNDADDFNDEKKNPILLKYLDKDFSQNLMSKQEQIDNQLIAYLEKEIIRKEEEARSGIYKEIGTQENKEEMKQPLAQIMKLANLRYRIELIDASKCVFDTDYFLEDVVERAKNIINGWGGRLIFVYLPSPERYEKNINLCRKYFFYSQKRKIISIFKKFDIPFIDIDKVLINYQDINSLYPFGQITRGIHFNSKGYRLVAQKINEYIEQNPN